MAAALRRAEWPVLEGASKPFPLPPKGHRGGERGRSGRPTRNLRTEAAFTQRMPTTGPAALARGLRSAVLMCLAGRRVAAASIQIEVNRPPQHLRARLAALLMAVAVLLVAAQASAATKTVLVGPDNTLTFRDMESGDSTTTVTAGDTVRWEWVSGTHSTTRFDAPETWDSAVHSTPFSFSRQFMVPGTFPYLCTVHVSFGMTGTVVVLPAGASTTSSTLTSTTTSSTTTLPPALKCEDAAMRRLARLGVPIVKCHAKAARRAFKHKPFDEEACEVGAKAQFDRAARKLPAACPACLLGARAALRDQVEALLLATNGAVFCAAGMPLGADNTGSVSPDKASLTCGIKVMRNAETLLRALVACRIQTADSAFRMAPFDAEACRGAAETSFGAAVGRIKRCPACLDSGRLRDAVKAAVDRIAADAYCSE